MVKVSWKKMDGFERKILTGLIIALLLFFLVGIIFFIFLNNSLEITNFEECIAAGNPAMESYPRQCIDPIGDKHFVEVIKANSPLTGSIINDAETATITTID